VANEQFDLNEWAQQAKYEVRVTSESEAEMAARLQEAAKKAEHDRMIQKWIILLAIFVVLATFLYCGYVLGFGSPEDKKWASTIAITLVGSLCSGLAGFLIGKKGS
jgi:type VI protein secretion system component VasF